MKSFKQILTFLRQYDESIYLLDNRYESTPTVILCRSKNLNRSLVKFYGPSHINSYHICFDAFSKLQIGMIDFCKFVFETKINLDMSNQRNHHYPLFELNLLPHEKLEYTMHFS